MIRRVTLALLFGVLALGWNVRARAQDASCDEGQIRAGIERVINDGFNAGDMSAIDQVMAEDYIAHPDDTDREAFKALITALRGAMPNGMASTSHMLVEGCDAFFAFDMSGTMEGDLAQGNDPAIPATGQNLDLATHVYLHFNPEGQAVEEWDYSNDLSLLQQVGLIPGGESAMMPADTAAGASGEDAAAMMTPSGNEARNTETVRRAYEEAFNTGNLDLLNELYSPDYAGHNVNGAPTTLADLTGYLGALRSAMPDAMITINGSVAEGDEVATRVTLGGTFQNELVLDGQPPIPPTGQPVILAISFLHRLDDSGLIVEDWESYDQVSLLSQLGVFAAPEATEQPG